MYECKITCLDTMFKYEINVCDVLKLKASRVLKLNIQYNK